MVIFKEGVKFINFNVRGTKQLNIRCHNLFKTTSAGPQLHNIYGKKSATQPGFGGYSQDLRSCNFVWSKQKLYELLCK